MTGPSSIVSTFLHHLRFFHRLVGRRMLLLVLLMLLTTWTEGLGIALLLPLFSTDRAAARDPISAAIVDVVSAVGFPPTTAGILLALVTVAFLKGMLTLVTVSYQHFLSAKIIQDLRRELIAASGGVDYLYVVRRNTGALVNVILGEAGRASGAFLFFSKLFPHAITIAIFLVIVTVLDWQLTLVSGALGGTALLLLRLPVRLTRLYSGRISEQSTVLAAFLIQTNQSFKYLVATAKLDRLQQKILRSVRQLTVLGYRVGILAAVSYSLPQPVIALLLAGILYYQLEVKADPIATGLVLLLYLYRMMNEIFNLQSTWQNLATTAGGVDAVASTLEELKANREPTGDVRHTTLRDSIELRNVTFTYAAAPPETDGGAPSGSAAPAPPRERTVLRDVSLRIPRHSTVAFVGESGAGKSTLVDLVCGVLKPASGAILVDGRDLRELDLRSWRETIGYVPQDAVMFDDSVANNVTLWSCDPADPACRARIEEATRQACCEEFLARMPEGLESSLGERGVRLSGGQRQRLSIARELFKRPEVLILDEATSALDTESEHFIRQSIESLRGRMTLLVIAHRLSTIKGCDLIHVLQDGRIVESGTWAELVARDGSRFQHLVKLQNL